MLVRKTTFLISLALAASCGTTPRDDAGAVTTDAGSNDAGSNDAGSNDAGLNDAGSNDGGSNDDAGSSDAGFSDAGSTDAGPDDAGADAGSSDAGSSDAGFNDAGSNDAGSNDAGSNDAGADAGARDAGSRHLVFLNFCGDGGCTYSFGADDSRLNRSGVVPNPPRTLSATTDLMTRTLAANCFRGWLAPYDVVVTESDPSPAPHVEIVAAGTPMQLGQSPGISYVATMNCAPVENGIGFAFIDVFGNADPDGTCQALGQAWGSLMGLEAVTHCADVMAYTSCGPRSFTDVDAGCGTFSPAACMCPSRTSQNSHRTLLDLLGPHP